ncbi:MAG: thiamine-binding protein [Clostridiales bacterium]|jgi:uncharacterized protein YqgV (UPF0045/DUF77 family)|nr:thiamine-binding protein [Clostridiales bacterium]
MGNLLANCGVAIQVLPQGVSGREEVKGVVDKVIAYLYSTGLSVFVGPFETTVEGDFDHLMEVVKKAQIIAVEAGCTGLLTYLKISYDPAGVWTTQEKIGKYHG